MLVVSPYFPPRRRVGALRAYKLAKHLGAAGVDVGVVTLATPGALTAHEASALAGIPILALGSPFDRTTRRSTSSHVRETSTRRVDPLLDALDRRIPVDGWWPLFAANAGRIERFALGFRPDVVLGTADPWSSLLVARAVARRLGRPFVADMRDPWTLCEVRGRERPDWVRALDRRIEGDVLASAAAVVFTAESAAARYRDHYGARLRRVETVMNGFDDEDFAPSADADASVTGTTRRGFASPRPTLDLLHFGGFRPLAPATPVVALLEHLRRLDPSLLDAVRVQSVGPLTQADRDHAHAAGVLGCFEDVPPVPYERARERQREADALLVVADPRRRDMIPGKLFDALPTGRPLLVSSSNPEVERIVARTRSGVVFASAEAGAHAVAELVRAKRRGEPMPLAHAPEPDAIASFGASKVAVRFAELVRELAA